MKYDPTVVYVLRHKDGKRYLSENSDGVLSWRGWGGSTLTSVPQCFGQVSEAKQAEGEWLPHDDEEKGKPIPRDFWCQAAKGR